MTTLVARAVRLFRSASAWVTEGYMARRVVASAEAFAACSTSSSAFSVSLSRWPGMVRLTCSVGK